jgi:hypothetical protein
MNVCIYVRTCTYACMYMCMYICMYVCTPNSAVCHCSFCIAIGGGDYFVLCKVRATTLISRNATVTSQLLAGTAWLTAKRYKIFPIRVKYRSIKIVKSTYLFLRGAENYVPVPAASRFISERAVFFRYLNSYKKVKGILTCVVYKCLRPTFINHAHNSA